MLTNMNYLLQDLIKQVLGVLKTIAGNDKVKIAIVEADGIDLILFAMNKHARSAAISEMGCAALTTLALRNPEHSNKIMSTGGAEVIVKAMQIHKDKASVQVNILALVPSWERGLFHFYCFLFFS